VKADIIICGNDLEVEWDYKITTHGNGGVLPSMNYPGDPPEPAEFDIEILGLEFPKQAADIVLDMPTWLSDLIATHLYERDDINEIVQKADQERGSYDYDD
jgi:hypothetical protein